MADGNITVDRSYVDNYSVKEFAMYELVPKYFDEDEVSDRTIGMVGYTTEILSQLSEDAFNTGSVLFRESFPNRAEIPESIYSHAAIFQLNDVFATAASCKFLLVMDESAILKNMTWYKNDLSSFDGVTLGMYHFYIDKDTIITVNDIDYSLDYDIQLNIVKKKNDDGTDEYLFTGRYLMTDYTGTTTEQVYNNSISDLYDPYVKIRRSGDGFIALEAQCHQMYREVIEEEITSNTVVNYSTIDVTFYSQLAGFDVLYKSPDSSEWKQMDTRIIYSQPTTDPFCYYQFIDDGHIKISFNSEDNYFTPEFNAKLKIILYLTDGEDGNFDLYEGDDITITPNTETYHYTYAYLSAARPIGASLGGQNQGDLTNLQNITVENYRTATALTTENDLQEYFNNYKYYYGDSDILFIKKRNDIFERIYSPFMVMRKDEEYIYNTNTLKLHLNIDEMKNPEPNIYMLEPGYVFTCNENNGYAEFVRNTQGEYIASDGTIVTNVETNFTDYKNAILNDYHDARFVDNAGDYDLVPDYLKRPCSFALFKQRYGLEDKRQVFDLTEDDFEEMDNPNQLKFLVMNPFLIYFRKNPNIVSTYMTFVNNTSLLDFTAINEGMYVQFIANMFYLKRDFEAKKRYRLSVKLSPSIEVSEENAFIDCKRDASGKFIEYIFNDKYGVENNNLRVIVEIRNGKQSVCFTELYPVSYDDTTNVFEFANYIYTDDHISSDSRLRILDDTIYRFYSDYEDDYDGVHNFYTKGEYFKVHPDDNTKYTLYRENPDGTIDQMNDNVQVNTVTRLYKSGVVRKYSNVINMSSLDDILVPMTDVVCKIYTLVGKNYDSATQSFIDFTTTNNKFASYDDEYNNTYEYYHWTNEYMTGTYAVDFMKPLHSVRTHLIFDDFTQEFPTGNEEDSGVYTLYKDVVSGCYYRKPSVESETYTLYDFKDDILQEGIYQEELDVILENGTFLETTFPHEILDSKMFTVGFLRASVYNNKENLDYFLNSFASHYDFLTNIIETRLRNETNLDLKFYNTYGRSSKITIGEENEILNTVNLSIEFDMWFVSTTDMDTAIPEIKTFIKNDIETLNEKGLNNVYVSNLMRKIENNFSYVDHIRFVTINDYISTYQTVRSKYEDITEMSVEEIRDYVPELMVINLSDITINEYFV